MGITSNKSVISRHDSLQECKYSVSHVHNTHICQYKKQLINIANTDQESDTGWFNVNCSKMLYDNLSSFSIQETGVDVGHYSAQYDSGHTGTNWTQNTPDLNGLQSITTDGLQLSLCHTFNPYPKAFESVRPGYHCHNMYHIQNRFAPMHYTSNQLMWCTVGFTNKYWQNTDQSVDTQLVFISDPREVQGFYYWNLHKASKTITLARCSDAQVSFLCVYGYYQIPIKFHNTCDTKQIRSWSMIIISKTYRLRKDIICYILNTWKL